MSREIIKRDGFNDSYVLFDCATFGLEDNTMGKVGYHSVYLPTERQTLTPAMEAALLKLRVKEDAEQKAKNEQERKEIEDSLAKTAPPRNGIAGHHYPCPKCGTYCQGDCEAN